MKTTLNKYRDWFEDFAERKIAVCRRDAAPMRLKLEHTRRVAENAREIAKREQMPDSRARLCVLAALLHDAARFDQYLEYGTFKDRDSFNHGSAGTKILKKENLLAEEDSRDRKAIYAAVCFHNRIALPGIADENALAVCQTVRDADKLDILRVRDECLSRPGPYSPTVVLSLPDRKDIFSEKAIAAALSGKSASYGDLLCVNDLRVLLGSWFFDLHFKSSRQIFLADGRGENLARSLPGDGPYAAAREFLLESFARQK